MAVDKEKLRKTITAILEDADLDTVSAKKVRQQVEEKLKIDLTDRKKEVDDLVMEIVEEKQDANKSDESEDEAKPTKGKRRGAKKDDSDEDSEDDYEPQGKKSKGKKGSDSDEDTGKKKKPSKAKGKKSGGGTGYTKTCTLSPELSLVMGETAMARHEVVKKMWSIIKEKNLYDPKNKQFAICDEKLLPVFGVKRFRTFGMMKYLKNHFVD